MLSNKIDGKKLLRDLGASAASFRTSAERLERLTARLETAQGVLPRLTEDRQYATELLGDIRRSSLELGEILHKINTGQGTLGSLVNDPSLYYEARGLLGSGGWGFSIMRGLYGLTHPFSRSGTEAAEGSGHAAPPAQGGGAISVQSDRQPSSAFSPLNAVQTPQKSRLPDLPPQSEAPGSAP